MYAIAGQGVDPDGLPVDPMEMSPEKDARIESIFWIGNLVLFVIAFISLIYLLMSPINGYWWLLPAVIMMLTFLGGLEFTTRIPNEHLAEFHEAMRHYETLLIIDFPLGQVSRVEDFVHNKHPEAVVSDVGWGSGRRFMMNTAENIYHTINEPADREFPYAPDGWSRATGLKAAKSMNLLPGSDHWRVVQALQGYYSRHETERINMRELADALDEIFHTNGGMKYLYKLFPGGPLTQGCRMAGLEPPAGAIDKGFGSAV